MKHSEVSAFAANLTEYYNLFLRNGWVLPARKCGMITREYLQAVSLPPHLTLCFAGP